MSESAKAVELQTQDGIFVAVVTLEDDEATAVIVGSRVFVKCGAELVTDRTVFREARYTMVGTIHG